MTNKIFLKFSTGSVPGIRFHRTLSLSHREPDGRWLCKETLTPFTPTWYSGSKGRGSVVSLSGRREDSYPLSGTRGSEGGGQYLLNPVTVFGQRSVNPFLLCLETVD